MANSGGFSVKKDYLTLATSVTGLAVKTSNAGRSNSVDEATDDNGDYIARDVFGDQYAPTCEYAVTDEVDTSDIALGTVVTLTDFSSAKAMLSEVDISTSAGQPPSVSASSAAVESGASTGRTFELPEYTLSPRHKAQILYASFTLSGTGCSLNTCNAKASIDPTVQSITGSPVSSDAHGGKIVVTGTIVQTGSTEPTVAAAAGWDVTKLAARDNPDADYVVWDFEVTKSITATEASS